MQEIDFYLVDAFSDKTFGGNAAAVCPLEEWLPDETLLKMAQQIQVIRAAQTPVADDDNICHPLRLCPGCQQRMGQFHTAAAQRMHHLAALGAEGAHGIHCGLRPAQLCNGDHLHGLGDLLRAGNALDAAAQPPDICHAIHLLRLELFFKTAF